MSLRKIVSKKGEVRWEVRSYMDGRGSSRLKRLSLTGRWMRSLSKKS